MIVCAFDLATATGACDGAPGAKPRCWSWYLSDAGDSRPARLLMLARFLRAYFAKELCDRVVYEAPMPLGVIAGKPGKRGMIMSEANVAFARGAVGVLEMTCAEYDKPVEGVRVQDARASVLGWRTNRGETDEGTKARVIREVTQLHGIKHSNGDTLSDNECDAYVAWAYACALQNPRLAAAMTPLFRGGVMPRKDPAVYGGGAGGAGSRGTNILGLSGGGGACYPTTLMATAGEWPSTLAAPGFSSAAMSLDVAQVEFEPQVVQAVDMTPQSRTANLDLEPINEIAMPKAKARAIDFDDPKAGGT